jgi:hypothetical protein
VTTEAKSAVEENALTATHVLLYCKGRRKKDASRACGHLLADINYLQFVGLLSIKCEKCDTVNEFR